MTGLLIFGGIILLLVLALEPAQRRLQKWAPHPGADSHLDRDTQRVRGELSSRTPVTPVRAARRWHAPQVRRHSAA